MAFGKPIWRLAISFCNRTHRTWVVFFVTSQGSLKYLYLLQNFEVFFFFLIFPFQDAYAESRANAVATVEKTIVDLSSIFTQLGNMIQEQEEQVMRYVLQELVAFRCFFCVCMIALYLLVQCWFCSDVLNWSWPSLCSCEPQCRR